VRTTDEILRANDEILGHESVTSAVIPCSLFLFVQMTSIFRFEKNGVISIRKCNLVIKQYMGNKITT
jgi:hypothetical protein